MEIKINRKDFEKNPPFTVDHFEALHLIVSKLYCKVNSIFKDLPDISIHPTIADTAWYFYNPTIMISSSFFSKTEDEQLVTIAHELAHHVIDHGFGEHLKNKYSDNEKWVYLSGRKLMNCESLADFIVKYELNLSQIDKFRDGTSIEKTNEIFSFLNQIT